MQKQHQGEDLGINMRVEKALELAEKNCSTWASVYVGMSGRYLYDGRDADSDNVVCCNLVTGDAHRANAHDRHHLTHVQIQGLPGICPSKVCSLVVHHKILALSLDEA